MFFSFFITLKIIIIITLDNKKLIVARDNPKIRKSTFLQLFVFEFSNLSNSFLSVIFSESLVHPENSLKISCSIPKWYPESIKLETKVINKTYNQTKFLEKLIPKKDIKIAIKKGTLW